MAFKLRKVWPWTCHCNSLSTSLNLGELMGIRELSRKLHKLFGGDLDSWHLIQGEKLYLYSLPWKSGWVLAEWAFWLVCRLYLYIPHAIIWLPAINLDNLSLCCTDCNCTQDILNQCYLKILLLPRNQKKVFSTAVGDMWIISLRALW